MQAAKAGSNGENEPGGEGEEPDEDKLSGALVEDLTAHRRAKPLYVRRGTTRVALRICTISPR